MVISEPFKPPDHATSFTSSERLSNEYATTADEDGSDPDDRRDSIDVSMERRGARNTRTAVAMNHRRSGHHETDGEIR